MAGLVAAETKGMPASWKYWSVELTMPLVVGPMQATTSSDRILFTDVTAPCAVLALSTITISTGRPSRPPLALISSAARYTPSIINRPDSTKSPVVMPERPILIGSPLGSACAAASMPRDRMSVRIRATSFFMCFFLPFLSVFCLQKATVHIIMNRRAFYK